MSSGSLGIKNPNDLYVAMLQSSNIQDKLVKRFDLQRVYEEETLTAASQHRMFFEQQLRQAKAGLTDAEPVLERTPNTSLQYLDAVRNLKYQESIYEILAKQFEMAKLDEARDYPLIQALDQASPPEEESRPKCGLIVALATFATIFIAVVSAFVREGLLRARQVPQQAERLQELREALRWKK